MQGMKFQSLVGELRSHMPCCVGQNKTKNHLGCILYMEKKEACKKIWGGGFIVQDTRGNGLILSFLPPPLISPPSPRKLLLTWKIKG